MTLQILISHYKEGPPLIGRLLRSIDEQRDVDFKMDCGVIICSDGTENILPQEFLTAYSVDIEYLVRTHRGICATRNTLLDAATADYVMFCDADDCFGDRSGLSVLMNAAKEQNCDVISSPFDRESIADNRYRYHTIRFDRIHVHGKLFRREYLVENGIRFPDEMETTGDMYFLWQAFHMTEKVLQLPDCVYIWKWNADSVTRAQPFYVVRTYDRMLRTYTLLAENLIERKRSDLYNKLISWLVFTVYLDWFSDYWKTIPPELVSDARKAGSAFIRRFADYYAAIPADYRYKKYNEVLIAKRTYGPPSRYAGLDPWIEMIRKEDAGV